MPNTAPYRRARDLGVCPSCRAAPDGGHVYCAACRARMAALNRATGAPHQRDVALAALGRCRDCGASPPSVRGAVPRCDSCRASFNANERQRKAAIKARGAT